MLIIKGKAEMNHGEERNHAAPDMHFDRESSSSIGRDYGTGYMKKGEKPKLMKYSLKRYRKIR